MDECHFRFKEITGRGNLIMAKIAHFPKQNHPLKPRINSDCMHQKTNIVFSLTQDKIYQKITCLSPKI